MRLRAQRLTAAAAALWVAGCGWVDGSGRQHSTAPAISADPVQDPLEEQTLHWPASALDADGNLSEFRAELVAQGSAVERCANRFGPLVMAPDLRSACLPTLDEADCQVRFARRGDGVDLHIPALRRPAGLRYEVFVRDADGLSDSETIELCVDSVSSAPRAVDDRYSVPYRALLEHSGNRYDEQCQLLDGSGVLRNDEDDFDFRESQAEGPGCLQARLVEGPARAAEFALALDGGFRYRGDGSLPPGGVDHFRYRANDGSHDSETVTVHIEITGDNRAPQAQTLRVAGDEDRPLRIPIASLGSDPEGTVLGVVSLGEPSAGTVVIEGDALLFRPPPNFAGESRFAVVIADAAGAQARAEVVASVRELNDPPALSGLPAQLDIDVRAEGREPRRLGLRVADEESEAARLLLDHSLDSAVVAVLLVAPDSDGTAHLSITPQRDGEATLTLFVIDEAVGDLPANRRPYTLPITVRGLNRAPLAVDDRFEGLVKGAGAVLEPLANDSDPDGDPLRIVEILRDPDHGTVAIGADAERLLYRPAPGFSGEDSLRYRIEDSQGASAAAQITLQVLNRPPTVQNESISLRFVRDHRFDPLANDSDPDGDPLSWSLGALSGPASSRRLDDGRLLVSIDESYSGTVVINYTVSDGDGGKAAGLARLRIDNDRP